MTMKKFSRLLGFIALTVFLSSGCKANAGTNITQGSSNDRVIIIENNSNNNSPKTKFKIENWESHKKTKTIKKLFKNISNEDLHVFNKYGNIVINVWDRKEVDITVEVKIATSNAEYTQELLDNIDVKFDRSHSNISARTIRKEENHLFGKRRSRLRSQISIDYTIHIPRKMAMDLELHYGNITLPEKIEAKTKIALKYGTLKGSKILENLTLDARYSTINLEEVSSGTFNLAYCSKSSIDYIEQGEMDLRYSSLRCEQLGNITTDLAYSNLKAKNIEHIKADCRYSTLTTDMFNYIKVDDFAYSKLYIESQEKEFEALIVPSARYSKVNINLSKKIKPEMVLSEHNGIRINEAFQNKQKRNKNIIEYNGRYSNLNIDAL